MHGKTSIIAHDSSVLFSQIQSPFVAMRYHSLIADEETFPSCLTVTSRVVEEQSSNDIKNNKLGAIMSLEHKKYPIYGVQFHPESIGSPSGKQIIKNFLCI
jgi:anthranilate/para-aminobenzoate synthase component II